MAILFLAWKLGRLVFLLHLGKRIGEALNEGKGDLDMAAVVEPIRAGQRSGS